MICNWRIVAAALAGGVTAAIALAAPAAADVTVTPAVAPRGGPAALVFSVAEERAGAHTTKVELLVPEATPIAEVYPMSVVGWAPIITSRKLDKPVELIHGTSTEQVVSKVTWKRVGRAATKPGVAGQPGQGAQLKLSMGPMPQAEQVAFTIIQTYSDGTVVRWADPPAGSGAQPTHPAPVVTLLDVSSAAGTHGDEPETAAASAATPAQRDGGESSRWVLGAVLLVILAFVVEGWILVNRDRRTVAGAAH